MVQQLAVILAVVVCAAWLGVQMYRYIKPKPGGKACAGGCCDGEAAPKPPTANGTERIMMISSDDMRARLKARRG